MSTTMFAISINNNIIIIICWCTRSVWDYSWMMVLIETVHIWDSWLDEWHYRLWTSDHQTTQVCVGAHVSTSICHLAWCSCTPLHEIVARWNAHDFLIMHTKTWDYSFAEEEQYDKNVSLAKYIYTSHPMKCIHYRNTMYAQYMARCRVKIHRYPACRQYVECSQKNSATIERSAKHGFHRVHPKKHTHTKVPRQKKKHQTLGKDADTCPLQEKFLILSLECPGKLRKHMRLGTILVLM